MNHSFESLDELLDTVRRTGNPSADDRRAVRRSLSALFATAVTTSTAVASAAAKATLLSKFLWPFATGALLGGAVIVTTTVVSRPELFGAGAPPSMGNPIRPATVPGGKTGNAPEPLTPPGELPRPAPTLPQMQRVPEPGTPERPMPESRQVPAPAAEATTAPSPAASTLSPTLDAESRALAEAQRALRDNDAEWALGMLAQQDRTFAGGVLVEERAAARVFALCAAGRRDEGRAKAVQFQSRFPGSLLRGRVRQACEP